MEEIFFKNRAGTNAYDLHMKTDSHAHTQSK